MRSFFQILFAVFAAVFRRPVRVGKRIFGVSRFLLFPNRRKRVITSLEVDFSTKQANQVKLNCVIVR